MRDESIIQLPLFADTLVRRCAGCGKALERRVGEKIGTFEGRKTCGRQCGYESARAKRRMQPPPKTCTWCGKTFERRPDEQATNWAKRKTCSWECRCAQIANSHWIEASEIRTCEGCGAEIVRRASEKPKQYEKRRFCGRECQTIALAKLNNIRVVPRTKIICRGCGEPFFALDSHHRTYCSYECAVAHVRQWPGRRTKAEPRVGACAFCGAEFLEKAPSEKRKYCSMSCAANALIRRQFQSKPTKIERLIGEALDGLGIRYEAQYRIGRFMLDFFLPDHNIAIEAHGTFWHCDPRAYPNGPISIIQERSIARDKRKADAVRAVGVQFAALWEQDIHNLGAVVLIEQLLAMELPSCRP